MELRIENLYKNYQNNQVLKGINFTFKSGRIYGLLGRNGAGKTTMFRCVSNDIVCNSGSFYLGDREVKSDDIAFVSSEPEVPDFLTGYEFISFLLSVHENNLAGSTKEQRIQELMELISLKEDDIHKLLRDYSHGMKSKIMLIANLILPRQVLLLDEPLNAVDVVAAEEIKKLLRREKEEKIVIMSTHFLDLALNLCEEIVLLDDGVLRSLPRLDLNDQDFRTSIIKSLQEHA